MKVEIDINKPLSPGDIIELHFRSIGLTWIRAAQVALIEWQIKDDKRFEILSSLLWEETGVIFTVRVLQTNPVVVTAAVIGAAIIAAGVVAWLMLDKVYQISESPAGKIALGGIGSLAIVAAIAGLLAMLPRK